MHERAWLNERMRTVWVEGKGWKWVGKAGNGWGDGPVGMSERGCADVCGRCCKERLEIGGERCKRKVGNLVGRRTGRHERAWMRGRCGCKGWGWK